MVGIGVGVGVSVREAQRVDVPSRWCNGVRGVDVQIRISQLYALHSGSSAHVVLRGIPRRDNLQECQLVFRQLCSATRRTWGVAVVVTVQWQLRRNILGTLAHRI